MSLNSHWIQKYQPSNLNVLKKRSFLVVQRTFRGNNFLGQMVSFGICQGVVFSHDKIHCLDPSKQPRALANLWMLASLASQIQNAQLRLCLHSASWFFNLALLSEKLGQITLVVFQGPDNYILWFVASVQERLLFKKILNPVFCGYY